MSALFLNLRDTYVVTEVWFVPGNDRWAISGDNPKITRAVFDLGRYFVSLQLLALVATVSGLADSLSAVRRYNPLDATNNIVVSSPGEHQTLIKNRFRSAVPNLLLNFVRHVKCSAPNLNLRQVSLESWFGITFSILRSRFSQNGPSAENNTIVIVCEYFLSSLVKKFLRISHKLSSILSFFNFLRNSGRFFRFLQKVLEFLRKLQNKQFNIQRKAEKL